MSVSGSRPTQAPMSDAIEVGKPDLFYGDREKLEDWILTLDLYFKFDGKSITENLKVQFSATFMKGRAMKWIKPLLRQYLDGDDMKKDDKRTIDSFATFKEDIRRLFGTSNKDKVAVRAVQTLQQRKAASEYAAQFKQYSADTEWDDQALMVMFCRELKDNMKDELMRTGAAIDNLDGLIEEAIKLDDALHERDMEKRHSGGRSAGRAGFRPGNPRPRSQRQTYQDSYGPMPMELDTLGRNGFSKKPKGGSKTRTSVLPPQERP